ncbi:Uu.00g019400.m01.CDS01 [Anthostomella pinea]|uniref:Uu.00g019400.m01.CDS01 n=1 Tax=Anthostomella pinea TaxID=933095 RepID=A0AAI8YQT8_9PEZI|nr:Uu.00g019400.m01.CDS01 [Anthostomella pinea]
MHLTIPALTAVVLAAMTATVDAHSWHFKAYGNYPLTNRPPLDKCSSEYNFWSERSSESSYDRAVKWETLGKWQAVKVTGVKQGGCQLYLSDRIGNLVALDNNKCTDWDPNWVIWKAVCP